MSSSKPDISQLRQYLNGELDARAMHELEKHAQADPLLMDALEGYEATNVIPGAAGADLQQRLQQRIGKPERRLTPWAGISIAASVLLAGSVGLWLYLTQQRPAFNQIAVAPAAAIITPPGRPAPLLASPAPLLPQKSKSLSVAAVIARKPAQKQLADHRYIAQANQAAPAADVFEKAPEKSYSYDSPADSNSFYAEPVVSVQRKMTLLGGKAKIPTIKPGSQQEMISQQLAGRVEGVMVETPPGQSHQIVGQLLDDTGRPLPGALVRAKNAGSKAFTDKNGYFKVNAEHSDVLSLSYIGFESRDIKAAAMRDSQKMALQPSQQSLAEVAIAPVNAKPATGKATPVTGAQAYQQFLNSFVAPGRQTGIIRLEMVVNADGRIGSIQVLQGLTPAANKAATDYVRKGPAWQGNTNGKPETVIVQLNVQ